MPVAAGRAQQDDVFVSFMGKMPDGRTDHVTTVLVDLPHYQASDTVGKEPEGNNANESDDDFSHVSELKINELVTAQDPKEGDDADHEGKVAVTYPCVI